MTDGTTPLPESDRTRVLRDRARALARPDPLPSSSASSIEVLEFRLARERFALETLHVVEVSPLKELTPLPCTPAFIRGVVNVRGRILPVLDLKQFFQLPDQGLTDLHSIILIEGRGLALGLLADAIVGVGSVPGDSLQTSSPVLEGIMSDYLKGVTAESLVVLDVGRILSDPRIVVHDEV